MPSAGPEAEIKSVDELLEKKLTIPNYQRPYKWSRNSVGELLNDIKDAITNYEKHGEDFHYRIGTIILHKNIKNSEIYDIVDGQQRVITLSLIKYALGEKTQILSEKIINNDEAVNQIKDNYQLIKERISTDNNLKNNLKTALAKILEVVVITVNQNDLSEAFQLFDSQNSRGKALYPHDLLKAYHLREMDEPAFEKRHLVENWERIKPYKIHTLFNTYLYPILNWSRKENNQEFTAKKIEAFKGVANYRYTYARRTYKAMPYFQVNEAFCAGANFFHMTTHYLNVLEMIQHEINNNKNFKNIKKILDSQHKDITDGQEHYQTAGFGYAVDLFYCALLFYFDRFHSFDQTVVNKLFIWAMMLRVDMQNLGLASINKYALGDNKKTRYTNHIPMFYKIAIAYKESDIADLDVSIEIAKDQEKDFKNWRLQLHQLLKEEIVGEKENE